MPEKISKGKKAQINFLFIDLIVMVAMLLMMLFWCFGCRQ